MEWKSFFECLPKVEERILIVAEWLYLDGKLEHTKRCCAIYECNFKSFREGIVNLVNLKHIAGEKDNNFEKTQHIGANALHWARLN